MISDSTNSYKGNISKYYFAAIFVGFGFFYIVIQSLYLRQHNISFEQIGYLISATLITTFLLQIPTGYYADKHGKKKSILIATITKAIALSVIVFGNNLYVFFAGFILLGIGNAFGSGANSALLYESLENIGEKEKYLKHRGRLESVYVIGDIGASAIAPILFSINNKIPYFVAIGSLVFAFLIQTLFHEEKNILSTKRESLKNLFFNFSSFIKNKVIFFFIVFTGIFFILNTFFTEVVQSPLFIESKGFSLSQLSLIGLISSVALVLASFFIGDIEKKLGIKKSILSIIFLIPLSLIFLVTEGNIYVLGIVLAFYTIVTAFREIAMEHYLHKEIDNSNRATVLSFNSMFSSAISLICLPILGLIVDHSSIEFSVILSTGIFFVISLVLVFSNRKRILGFS